jgi:hypothetical protein
MALQNAFDRSEQLRRGHVLVGASVLVRQPVDVVLAHLRQQIRELHF